MEFSNILQFFDHPYALLAFVGLGTMAAVIGFGRVVTEKNPAAVRMSPKSRLTAASRNGAAGLTYGAFTESLMPEKEEERFAVTIALAHAGFHGPRAVIGYYATRMLLAIGLPALLLLLNTYSQLPSAPEVLASTFGQMSVVGLAQVVCVVCGIGFFGPSFWLRGRITKRQDAITKAFPNALDLIQIGVEAGLGFDQALMRVALEIRTIAPDLSEEILQAQNEIQAGRDRDKALMSMARRTGVEEVSSFVNVVLQSARFGTPLSDALKTYADEMRTVRELKAQEKANKLPVQMSAVMATLMLPAILLLTLGPVVIRYIDYFSASPTGG